jgi:hypothetical protein
MAKGTRAQSKKTGTKAKSRPAAKKGGRAASTSLEAKATPSEEPAPQEKITLQEWRQMCLDPTVPDEEIVKYSIFEPTGNGFEVAMKPDPDKVIASREEMEFENAMAVGNRLARFRRSRQFKARLKDPKFKDLPVLVSEGDSWFQFPFLVQEVIDHLGRDFNISSCGAAGDTAFNMVFRDLGTRPPEYLAELRNQKGRVKAFLFSAAGNDILGEVNGQRVLMSLLIKPTVANPTVKDVIDPVALGRQLSHIENAYRTVIETVRREPGFERLPIIIHGYDYSLAFPADIPGVSDDRSPKHAEKDQWLGSSYREKGIKGGLRHEVSKFLIDTLYDLLKHVAGDSSVTHVYVVDCRKTLKEPSEWIDEIHGTSAGFRKIATKFKRVINRAIQEPGV